MCATSSTHADAASPPTKRSLQQSVQFSMCPSRSQDSPYRPQTDKLGEKTLGLRPVVVGEDTQVFAHDEQGHDDWQSGWKEPNRALFTSQPTLALRIPERRTTKSRAQQTASRLALGLNLSPAFPIEPKSFGFAASAQQALARPEYVMRPATHSMRGSNTECSVYAASPLRHSALLTQTDEPTTTQAGPDHPVTPGTSPLGRITSELLPRPASDWLELRDADATKVNSPASPSAFPLQDSNIALFETVTGGHRALAEAFVELQKSQERAAERQAEQVQIFSAELMRTLASLPLPSAPTSGPAPLDAATMQRLVSKKTDEMRRKLTAEMRRDFAALEARAHARFVVRFSQVEARLHTELSHRLQAQDAQLRADLAANYAAAAPSLVPPHLTAENARANRLNDSRLRRNLPAWLASFATETPWHYLRTGFWTNPGFRSTLFALPNAALSATIWLLDELAAVVSWLHASGMLTLMSLLLNWATRMPRMT